MQMAEPVISTFLVTATTIANNSSLIQELEKLKQRGLIQDFSWCEPACSADSQTGS
jgi:hypothetical protein